MEEDFASSQSSASSSSSPSSALQDLPPYLLLVILSRGNFTAADLASVEACCYAFRAAHGLLPLRFKSVPEIAALDICRTRNRLFSSMRRQHQVQLLGRCHGSWKLSLRFLQLTEQANGHVQTPHGNMQVATGPSQTLLILDNKRLLACGHPHLLDGTSNDSEVQTTFVPVQVLSGWSIINVASSHLHTALITSNGELFVYGMNISGCCGLGQELFDSWIGKPILVETMRGIPCKQVATGASFTLVLTQDGRMYTCGANRFGQLGHGDVQGRHTLTEIQLGNGFPSTVQVSAGVNHSLAVTQDGALYSWGYGSNNALGHGLTSDELRPRLIEEFKNRNCFILHSAAGAEHSVAVDSNGKVYTWGYGYWGALGHGGESCEPIPKLVEAIESIRAVQVCTGSRKTFVLDDTGTVFAFGRMCFGSLGLGEGGNSDKVLNPHVVDALKSCRIRQVSTGAYHTMFISNKGVLLGCGMNEQGQLGLGDLGPPCPLPTQISLDEDFRRRK